MLRLRILLLLLWYYSITKATTENIANKHTTQQTNTAGKTRDDYLRIQQNNRNESFKNDDFIVKTKREISSENDNDDENASKDKRPEKNRRKVGSDYLDIIDTEHGRYLKNLASLISKYRGKYVQYGFVVGRAEDIIDLDMIRRCMTPVDIPKHFSPWLGKRGAGFQDAIQKKCLDTLVQPVDYRPASYETDDGKFLKPFRPWGGKRDSGDIKKTNFGAWGGKRNADAENIPKKSTFTAWVGKRAPEYPFNPVYPHDRYYHKNYDPEYMNRPLRDASFSAWGGKRAIPYAINPNDFDEMKKRNAQFSAWGGKRAIQYPVRETQTYDKFNPYLNNPENMERQSRISKFSAWGGKRSFSTINPNFRGILPDDDELEELIAPSSDGLRVLNDDLPDALVLTRNRINVQSMGNIASIEGQLFPSDFEDEFEEPNIKSNQTNINNSIKEKRNFSAWGGKRQAPEMDQDIPERKRKFGAWGGKRSMNDDLSTLLENDVDIDSN